MNLESMLTTHYSEVADEPMPDSSLDLDRVVAGGRRRMAGRRVRYGSAGATAVAAVTALAVTATGAFPHGTHGPTTATAVTGGVAGLPFSGGTGIASVLTGTDPLIAYPTLGWMPPGYVAYAVGTGSTGFTEAAANAATGASLSLQLSDTSKGQGPYDTTPDGFTAPPASLGPTPTTVDGRQARWSYAKTDDLPTAGGAADSVGLSVNLHGTIWANLTLTDKTLPGGVTTQLMHIAQAMVMRNTSIPLPFHLPAAPTSLPMTDVGYEGLNPSQTAWSVSLNYGDFDCTFTSDTDCLDLSVVSNGNKALSDAPAHPGTGGQTATVPGGTATLYTRTGTSMIVVNANGMQITMTAKGIANTFVRQQGGILAYYNSITWLGLAQSGWTTHVIDTN